MGAPFLKTGVLIQISPTRNVYKLNQEQNTIIIIKVISNHTHSCSGPDLRSTSTRLNTKQHKLIVVIEAIHDDMNSYPSFSFFINNAFPPFDKSKHYLHLEVPFPRSSFWKFDIFLKDLYALHPLYDFTCF